MWKKEKEICKIKVENELSYPQARKQYEKEHDPPVLRSYATVVRSPSAAPLPPSKQDELQEKVEQLEKRVEEVLTLLKQLVANPPTQTVAAVLATEEPRLDRQDVPPTTQDTDTGAADAGPSHQTSDPIHEDVDRETRVDRGVAAPDVIVVQEGEKDSDVEAEDMESEGTEPLPLAGQDGEVKGPGQPQRPGAGQVGMWKIVGKNKTQNKKTCSNDAEDEINPSPVITRASRSLERAKKQPKQKKSWKDDDH